MTLPFRPRARRARRACWALAAAVALAALPAHAQPEKAPAPAASSEAKKASMQGVAVLASGATRDEAFALAREVYASALRPRHLDELRARILAGEPAPPTATRDVRELAELRAAVTGDDAASRRLLGSIAQQLDVQALLVVSRTAAPKPSVAETDEAGGGGADAGRAPDSADAGSEDAGLADAGAVSTDAGASAAPPTVSARLFLAGTGELDAARYEPDASGWRATVVSVAARFPPPKTPPTAQLKGPPPRLSPTKEERPFYASPWLWGAVGAAVLVGGFFFFLAQDTGDDPIHLQMRVPR